MKTIKIKICNLTLDDKFTYGYFIYHLLSQSYHIELSEDPDYLFYTDQDTEHLRYSCIKIYYTGENISPNFNLCDYAFGFDYLIFEDRYYRFPLYLAAVFYNDEELLLAGENYLTASLPFTQKELVDKKYFCSFVYSNYRSDEKRKLFFETLSGYKQVSSGGGYLNNLHGKKIKNKLAFETSHKFSIAFENSSRSGYTTEKIVSSLVAKTIPIYWGNPHIGKEFNTKRFINCHDYKDFNTVVERVKEIDNDDELYFRMMNEKTYAENFNTDEVRLGLENFLKNIIDQPLAETRRRTINPVRAKDLVRKELLMSAYTNFESKVVHLGAQLYRPFKKVTFFEKLKHMIFK